MPEVVNPISPPQFAGAPYADAMEVTGPPVLITIPEEFGPFLRTDARTVMVILQPHHFNYIPNPAFRQDTTGWVLTGAVYDGQTADYAVLATEDGAANKTAIEDILALPAPDGSTILVDYNGAFQSLVVDSGSTLTVAAADFPLSADVVGCRDWRPLTDSLDPDVSWVGQSMVLGGQGILRYQDQDSEGGQAFVYVGPEFSFDATGSGDWIDYSRGSAEWTFTAYVRGRGRVRMVMEAYLGEGGGVKGPVQGLNIPVVADPENQPFDKNTPRYIDEETGAAYELRPPPYYNQVWRPITVADPAALTDQQQPLVLDGAGDLWRPITPPPAAVPLYENVGTPTVVDHMPLTDDPTDPYLIVQGDGPETDGFVWQVNGPPYYELLPTEANATAIGSAFTPWIEIGAEGEPENDWQRLLVRTSASVGPDGTNFSGCHWIDARLEFEDAEGLWISALMLDSTEHPVAPYFDGGMTEDPVLDDFFWSDESQPNASISFYYRDRVARIRWLEQNMRYLVPVARPVQFFYDDWSRPHSNQISQQPQVARAKQFTI